MSISDNLIAVTKAGATLVPFGSFLVELFGDAVPSAHDRANQLANDLLRERIAALGDKIDEEYVKSDEFVDLTKSCLFIVQRTQHEEKLRGAANILANAASPQGTEGKLTYAELDHFARCLEALSLESLHVLREAVAGKTLNDLDPSRIATKLRIEDDLTVGLLRQLEACDFVLLSFSPTRYNGQDSVVNEGATKSKGLHSVRSGRRQGNDMKVTLPKLTGISVWIAGLSWEPRQSEKQIAQRVISFLEDRRVLYSPYDLEIPAHCVQSVVEIRHFLTEVLSQIPNESGFPQNLRCMRGACRKFMDAVGDSAERRELDMFRGGLNAWQFALALGDLRTTIGVHLAIIANKFGLGIEADLATIVPLADEAE